MSKKIFKKAGRVLLGIATEIAMAIFIIAVAGGLSWLIVEVIR